MKLHQWLQSPCKILVLHKPPAESRFAVLQVRILVKIIPQSMGLVTSGPEGGGNNRISEEQIKCASLSNAQTLPSNVQTCESRRCSPSQLSVSTAAAVDCRSPALKSRVHAGTLLLQTSRLPP